MGLWPYGELTNRGAGTSVLPVRFNAPPEVAFVTLRCFKERIQ